EAKLFLLEVVTRYRIRLLLDPKVSTANSTNKPWLLLEPTQIKEFNLTLLITTTKQLVEIARLLRDKYYFYKIPDAWIDIKENANDESKDNNLQVLPSTLPELKQMLTKMPNINHDSLPITTQENITSTIT